LSSYIFLQFFRGLIKGHAQNEDVFIGEAMTSKMFMDQETGIGLDLAAQIIQQESHHAALSCFSARSESYKNTKKFQFFLTEAEL
jgi:hypothetical protein